MIADHLVGSLINVLSLMGIIILLFWLYGDYSIDSFRQRMFVVRDELFDEARNGLIEFDHPAYGLLRGTMNGYIRFGHRLRLLEFLLFMVTVRKEREDILSSKFTFEKQWEKATSELKPATIERLKDYRSRMNRMVVEHLLLRSPIFFAFIGFLAMLVIPYIIQQILHFLEEIFKKPLMEMETAALAEGKQV